MNTTRNFGTRTDSRINRLLRRGTRHVITALALGALTLVVPSAGPAHAEEATVAPAAAHVNINTAPADALALLPRVGPAVAARIIEFREANGDFETAADLMLVRGVGEKTFALLEPYVTVSGDTTLSEKVRIRRPEEAAGDSR